MRTHHGLYNNCSSEQSARNYYQHYGNCKWQQSKSKQRASIFESIGVPNWRMGEEEEKKNRRWSSYIKPPSSFFEGMERGETRNGQVGARDKCKRRWRIRQRLPPFGFLHLFYGIFFGHFSLELIAGENHMMGMCQYLRTVPILTFMR